MDRDRHLTDWHWVNAPTAARQLTRVGGPHGKPERVFDPGPQGLRRWVPRAVNVRETIMNRLTSNTLVTEYRCQEKLNGVYGQIELVFNLTLVRLLGR